MTVTDEGAAALLRTSHYSDAPASSMRRIAVPAHRARSVAILPRAAKPPHARKIAVPAVSGGGS